MEGSDTWVGVLILAGKIEEEPVQGLAVDTEVVVVVAAARNWLVGTEAVDAAGEEEASV